MRSKTFLYAYVGLIVLYIGLVLGLPIDPEMLAQYSVSEFTARLVIISFAVPGIIIWLMSFYGFIRFREYGQIIKNEKEGPAFNKLVQGLMVLSFSLPINSILGSLLDFIAYKNPGFVSSATIIRNYLTLGYQLAAFSLIAIGALGLRNTLKNRQGRSSQKLAIATIIFSSAFTWLILASPFTQNIGNIYRLPEWLVLLTLVIPYLITWYMGVMAVKNLAIYQINVKGILYRQALSKLTKGIGLIVSLSIVIQLLMTLATDISAENVSSVVLLVYAFLALYAISFGLVAKGARHLKRLEEA